MRCPNCGEEMVREGHLESWHGKMYTISNFTCMKCKLELDHCELGFGIKIRFDDPRDSDQVIWIGD